jgi:type II secretory pathway pseudopilin PulG
MHCPISMKRECGFTYLALLLMIAVMGAVLGATAEVWHTAVQREKEKELLFVGDQFRSAIRSYYNDHSRYPHNLEDLLKDPQQAATRRYLRKIYRDPITGKNEWGLERRPDGQIMGVYSLSAAQPIKVAGFTGADSSFEGADKYSKWLFMYLPRQHKRGR